MPALATGGAGIDVKTVQFIVINDFQNVGMAANKEITVMFLDFFFNARGIFCRMTADVRHEYFHVLTLEMQFLRKYGSNTWAVYISKNAFDSF